MFNRNRNRIGDLQNEVVGIKQEMQGLFDNMMILMKKVDELEKKNKETKYMG